MLGNPKFDYGDLVSFNLTIDNVSYTLTGKIYIIDSYGTFEQHKDVSYDIMVEKSPLHNNESCLFKHIIETKVYKINN